MHEEYRELSYQNAVHYADDYSDNSAYGAEYHRFYDELGAYNGVRGAYRLADAYLARSLGDAHEHDVHNAHAAYHQRDGADEGYGYGYDVYYHRERIKDVVLLRIYPRPIIRVRAVLLVEEVLHLLLCLLLGVVGVPLYVGVFVVLLTHALDLYSRIVGNGYKRELVYLLLGGVGGTHHSGVVLEYAHHCEVYLLARFEGHVYGLTEGVCVLGEVVSCEHVRNDADVGLVDKIGLADVSAHEELDLIARKVAVRSAHDYGVHLVTIVVFHGGVSEHLVLDCRVPARVSLLELLYHAVADPVIVSHFGDILVLLLVDVVPDVYHYIDVIDAAEIVYSVFKGSLYGASYGGDRNHRAYADDDTQHGEQRAHLVRRYRHEGDLDIFKKSHYLSSPPKSKASVLILTLSPSFSPSASRIITSLSLSSSELTAT